MRTPRVAAAGRRGRRGERSGAAPRGTKPRRAATRRDCRGETLALLVVWPALIAAVLLMLVHAFIVTNARAEAELAASEGLRSAWRAAAGTDFHTPYPGDGLHPEVLAMAEAAKDAVARAAATDGGWRWWTPGVTEVQSDWCHPSGDGRRPGEGETGWVRVVVSGEVFGPLAALWPNRWDRVHAAAQGPAVLRPPEGAGSGAAVPVRLPAC